jgi:hypothetical protein
MGPLPYNLIGIGPPHYIGNLPNHYRPAPLLLCRGREGGLWPHPNSIRDGTAKGWGGWHYSSGGKQFNSSCRPYYSIRPHEGMVLVGGSIASQRVFMWEAIAEELKTPSYSYRPNQVVELVPPLSRGSFPHLMPKETIGLMRTDSRIQ